MEIIKIKKCSMIFAILYCLPVFCGFTCGSQNDNYHSQPTPNIYTENTESSAVKTPTPKEVSINGILLPRQTMQRYSLVDDLSFLLQDTSISALNLWGGSFSDLTSLKGLAKLEILAIEENVNIVDVTPLAGLLNLKVLMISGCDNINSIKPLAGLANLVYLFLQIENMSKTDCSELLRMQNLEELYFAIGNISTFNNISRLEKLKVASLDASCIEDDSISRLRTLTSLEDLELFGVRYNVARENNIKDIALDWIEPLNQLRKIRLEGFNIIDISPLANLPNLQEIDIRLSQVSDFTPLIKSKSLKMVSAPYGFGQKENDRETVNLLLKYNIAIGDWSDH